MVGIYRHVGMPGDILEYAGTGMVYAIPLLMVEILRHPQPLNR